MRGTDVDPLSVPFDPEVAVLAGQGKRNGRLWIGDGCIHPATVPSIRQLRRGRTSSDPQIETRPTPSSVAMQRIQAQVEEQNKLREEAEARAQRMEEQMMLQQQQLAQQQKMMEWMTQQMSQQQEHMRMLAMQPGGVTLPPLAPPPFTFPWAPPSSGSNNMPLGGLGNQEGTPPVPPMAGSHVLSNQNVARKL
ncbi:uncharacterized protein [Lolium perenne]|uniref:uncharacterized protein n=1 Tax=Lolium perenne TaxID=4522 RepID=UPI0021EA54F1|nr:uncharacterized protein LOC127348325 [Lolium perenne]